MDTKHTITIESDVPFSMEDVLCTAVHTALGAQNVVLPCEINVLITDEEGIQAINNDMRSIDAPTDVLSFPMFDLTPGTLPEQEDADPGTGLIPLGDMCISMVRVQSQAEEFGHSVERELAYLTVHSVLHLLGYDHLDEGEQKRQMRTEEERIMDLLGIGRE